MKSRKKLLVLTALAASISGCGADYDPIASEVKATQRDVYTKIEDCIADWGDRALCLQAAEHAAKQQQQQTQRGAHDSTVIVQSYPFYGPEYASGYRGYYHNGAYVTPRSNTASKVTPPLAPSSNFKSSQSAARAAGVSTGGARAPGSTSTGGRSAFGSTGARAGGGASS